MKSKRPDNAEQCFGLDVETDAHNKKPKFLSTVSIMAHDSMHFTFNGNPERQQVHNMILFSFLCTFQRMVKSMFM